MLATLIEAGIDELPILDIDPATNGPYIRNTLKLDKNENREQALFDIYRVMRPGEPPTIDTAEVLFNGLFSDGERYDLSAVGRVKMNMRLGLDTDDTIRILRLEDILEVLRTLTDLRDGRGEVDDIDNLGNRRVRSVGELMENQYRIGLLRMERAIKERMTLRRYRDRDAARPDQREAGGGRGARVLRLVAALAVHGPNQPALRDHAQASSLGAGPGRSDARARGLRSPRRAPDALWPHLPDRNAGRPEHRSDQLAGDARAREQVRLHRKPVPQGRRTASRRRRSSISRRWKRPSTRSRRPTPSIDEKGNLTEELVQARENGEAQLIAREEIDLMDVSPKQVVSVAAALIPFLENDDANRALMGSNMQRQAVPLLRADAPIVGTGMEGTVARDSGAAITARRTGVVEQVDSQRIVVRATEEKRPDQAGRRHLSSAEVPALEPEHLHHAAPDREGRRPGEG